MPNLKTWRTDKQIYSVDMMLAYLNTAKHPVEKIKVEELLPQLEKEVWDHRTPKMVLDKMDAKKYQSNAERIRHADMSYPIILTANHVIVDGYHRVAKAYMEGKRDIRAHVFDAALMRKFVLVKGLDFVALNALTIYDILELWTKRFC